MQGKELDDLGLMWELKLAGVRLAVRVFPFGTVGRCTSVY